MIDKNGELGVETTAAINEALGQIENAKELGKEVGQILKIKSNNSYKK